MNAPAAPSALSIRELGKSFGAVKALQDVSFDLAHGEVVGAGGRGVDEQVATCQRAGASVHEVEDDRVAQTPAGHRFQRLDGLTDLELAAVDHSGGGDAGNGGERMRERGAYAAGLVVLDEQHGGKGDDEEGDPARHGWTTL